MFHTDDYVHFLQHVNPDNLHQYSMELSRYNVDVDCPGQPPVMREFEWNCDEPSLCRGY